ncbi:MAG: ubiquitin-conjugating enzyme E2 [Candidatus Thermoplasmatota archaeon]
MKNTPLPKELLRKRLRNEIIQCKRKTRHQIEVSDATLSNFPITLVVTLKGIPGPVLRGGKLNHKFTHKFIMEITEDYPYQKPIVRWDSPIFHPNIMLPEDGGYVCTRLLDEWTFDSTVLNFFKGIESLLTNPNPANPYGTDSCTRAAEYFNRHAYKPPSIVSSSKTTPQIREEEEEDED